MELVNRSGSSASRMENDLSDNSPANDPRPANGSNSDTDQIRSIKVKLSPVYWSFILLEASARNSSKAGGRSKRRSSDSLHLLLNAKQTICTAK